MKNIDFLCAECGNEIAKEVKEESVIQKCLGVLEEDGIYAFVVYSDSKDQKTRSILKKTEEFLKKNNFIQENLKEESIYTDMGKLLLIKEIIQKALIYARYHAKAIGEQK